MAMGDLPASFLAAGVTIGARSLVVFAIGGGFVTFAAAYWISFYLGHMYYPAYFLSSSINNMPASSVGSFGLSPALFCMPVVQLVRYYQVESKEPNVALNKVSLLAACMMTLGGHTVAAFQWSSHLIIHLVGAALIFFSSVLNFLFQVYIDYKTSARGIGKWARIANTAIAFFSLCSMVIVWLIMIRNYSFEDIPHRYVLAMSVLELIFFAASLFVYGTYFFEFKGYRIKISVEGPEEARKVRSCNPEKTIDMA